MFLLELMNLHLVNMYQILGNPANKVIIYCNIISALHVNGELNTPSAALHVHNYNSATKYM